MEGLGTKPSGGNEPPLHIGGTKPSQANTYEAAMAEFVSQVSAGMQTN
jgi:hypothetical protein